MKINKELVEKVAKIARIELKEREIEKLIPEFSDILDLFSKINEVPTKTLTPQNKIKNISRPDIVEPSLPKKAIFLNNKHKGDGFFKGPKIK